MFIGDVIIGMRRNCWTTWYLRMALSWLLVREFNVAAPSFVNAASVGAKMVNGPMNEKCYLSLATDNN